MSAQPLHVADADARLPMFGWARLEHELDLQGCALLASLPSPQECASLVDMHTDDARFRSCVVMGRHGFGRGEYRCFDYPLQALVAGLRVSIILAWPPSPIAGTQ